MNFDNYFQNYLQERGFFADNAKTVMQTVKAAKENKSMVGRWGDDMSGYPHQIVIGLSLSVRDYALIWIDENCPEAWYRPVFEQKKLA